MRRSSILGALVLCALSLCAFAAANASAAELTAVTCEGVTPGTGNYSTSACETPKVAGTNFKTNPLPIGQTTEVTGTGVGNSIWTLTAAFLNVEITCEETHVEGHITNREPTAGKHTIEGAKIFIDYKKCHAALQSDTTKKCEVEDVATATKGTIKTLELKSTTTTDHNIKFEPVVSNFLEFKIITGGCGIPNVTVKVTGSLLGVADTNKHNHVTFTPATNGGLLKANGAAASYHGTVASEMKGATNPVGVQTFTPEG